MDDLYSRSEIILGKNAINLIKNSIVMIFGVGGVGSYTVESLARMGVGAITVVDGDRFSPSNLNRQLYATTDTVGSYKGEVARERILSINPDCNVKVFNEFYNAQSESHFDFSGYDYIVDATDSPDDKVRLIVNAQKSNVRIISCMGAGNKLDPTKFRVGDIYSTSVCPLARLMRSKLKDAGISSLKTVYSTETPIKPEDGTTVGSVSFVPSVAGLILAGEVIKDLIN